MALIDFKKLTFKVTDMSSLKPKEIEGILQAFNYFGFLLIESNPPQKSSENFLLLSHLFGKIQLQNQSDSQGIFPITLMRDYPEYANTSNSNLALHTDGSFEKIPPKVMAMHCEIPATRGGLTQLFDGKLVYEYLYQNDPEGLTTLFEPNIFTIKRDNQAATRGIFTNNQGRINLVFRADAVATISVQPKALKTFNLIKEFLAKPNNQISFKLQANQILVIDNTRILHGRTKFPANDKRKLNGLWFDGNSAYSLDLEFGFLPENRQFCQQLLLV